LYLEHFKLGKLPFQLRPDAEFLYLSEAHARARAYLDYTVYTRDGFVVITGEIGSGKTTLLKDLLARLEDNVVVGKVHQTQLDDIAFLQTLLVSFGIEPFGVGKAELLCMLQKFLSRQCAEGHQVLLVVDEAQYLSREVLEEIRFLAAVEIDGQDVLNVILVGHPELMRTIEAPGMEQLSQRVRLRFRLGPLSKEDTRGYIRHRLAVAGGGDQTIIPDSLVPLIYHYTGGVPRLVNILCDAALVAAYVQGVHTITEALLRRAADELAWSSYEARMKGRGTGAPESCHEHPKLVLSKKGIVIDEYVLDKECVLVGRNIRNDIVLEESVVSSHHAALHMVDGAIVVEDLDSTNGTYVNSRRIKKHVLINGDRIGITQYQLTYVETRPQTADQEVTRMMKGPALGAGDS
jgi:type II secretory pathway predicted ATPase ExeA